MIEAAHGPPGPGPGPRRFTELFAAKLARAWSGGDVKVEGPLNVTVTCGPKQHVLNLDHVWHLAAARPERSAQLLDEYLVRTLDMMNALENASGTVPDPAAVLPLIRSVRQVAMLDGQIRDDTVLSEPFVADLAVLYAVDIGAGYQFMHRSAAADADLADLRRRAVENLVRAVDGTVGIYGKGPVFTLTTTGDLGASCLLVDALCRKMKARVCGDLLAAVPERNTIVFSADTVAGRKRIANRALHVYRSATYEVSPSVLRYEAGGWELKIKN